MCGKDASADADKRLLGFCESLHDLFHLECVALAGRLIASYIALFWVAEIDRHFLNVHRNVDKHRTRSARACDIESLLENSCDVARVFEQIAVLYERFGSACDIGFLENVRADLVGIDLTRYADYRYRVGIRRSDSGYKISRTRTRGSYAHRRLARYAGVAVCSVTCVRLVSDKDVTYILFGIFQLVVERTYRRTGITVNGAYALCQKTFYHSFAYRHFHKKQTSTSKLQFNSVYHKTAFKSTANCKNSTRTAARRQKTKPVSKPKRPALGLFF